MSEHARWTDERLDDMAALVHSTAQRQEAARRELDRHEQEIKRIAMTGDRRSERHWQIYLLTLTVLGTSAANIIVTLANHH